MKTVQLLVIMLCVAVVACSVGAQTLEINRHDEEGSMVYIIHFMENGVIEKIERQKQTGLTEDILSVSLREGAYYSTLNLDGYFAEQKITDISADTFNLYVKERYGNGVSLDYSRRVVITDDLIRKMNLQDATIWFDLRAMKISNNRGDLFGLSKDYIRNISDGSEMAITRDGARIRLTDSMNPSIKPPTIWDLSNAFPTTNKLSLSINFCLLPIELLFLLLISN